MKNSLICFLNSNVLKIIYVDLPLSPGNPCNPGDPGSPDFPGGPTGPGSPSFPIKSILK